MLSGDARTSCSLAGANRSPAIQSASFWKGKLTHQERHPRLLKPRAGLGDAAEDAIRTLHADKMPPILRTRIGNASADGMAWVHAETRGP